MSSSKSPNKRPLNRYTHPCSSLPSLCAPPAPTPRCRCTMGRPSRCRRRFHIALPRIRPKPWMKSSGSSPASAACRRAARLKMWCSAATPQWVRPGAWVVGGGTCSSPAGGSSNAQALLSLGVHTQRGSPQRAELTPPPFHHLCRPAPQATASSSRASSASPPRKHVRSCLHGAALHAPCSEKSWGAQGAQCLAGAWAMLVGAQVPGARPTGAQPLRCAACCQLSRALLCPEAQPRCSRSG